MSDESNCLHESSPEDAVKIKFHKNYTYIVYCDDVVIIDLETGDAYVISINSPNVNENFEQIYQSMQVAANETCRTTQRVRLLRR